MCATMPAREFLGWMFFCAEEPFGAAWDNYLTAQICHVMTALKSKKAVPVEKFMWKSARARAAQRQMEFENLFDFFESKVGKQ